MFGTMPYILVFLFFVSPVESLTAEPLVLELGSPKYVFREKAERDLIQIGVAALPALRRGRQTDDAEISARCRRLLERYYQAKPSTYHRLPWIDMLPAGTREIQTQYLGLAGFWCNGCDWPNYREATRLFCRDLLEAGVKKELVIRMLDSMVKEEIEYRIKHGMAP